MIRDLKPEDIPILKAIHAANKLPDNCLPDFNSALFIINRVNEEQGRIAMAAFVKVTSEVYLLLDHTVGTAKERYEWLKDVSRDLMTEGYDRGLEDLTVFVPNEIAESFGKRLEEMGYTRSPWASFTMKL